MEWKRDNSMFLKLASFFFFFLKISSLSVSYMSFPGCFPFYLVNSYWTSASLWDDCISRRWWWWWWENRLISYIILRRTDRTVTIMFPLVTYMYMCVCVYKNWEFTSLHLGSETIHVFSLIFKVQFFVKDKILTEQYFCVNTGTFLSKFYCE